MSENHPWRDKERLREKYWGDGMTCDEIGEEWGCTGRTISTWLNKHGIETRHTSDYQGGPWRDKETLERMFVDQGLTSYEIADKLGCSQNAIMRWLKRHDIERPQRWKDGDVLREMYVEKRMTTYEIAEHFDVAPTTIQRYLHENDIRTRHRHPALVTTQSGYESIRHQFEYNVTVVLLHRLIALSNGELSVSDFIQGNKDVHHDNGIPWDNRPENLEVMTKAEHARLHGHD